MEPQNHPDPIQEALHHGLERAVQVASSIVTGSQVLVHLKRTHVRIIGERDSRSRQVLTDQAHANRAADRAWWDPALDPDWTRTAGLEDVTKAWSMAMPYADLNASWYDPDAPTAMRHCEDRLRELHPHAMERYDQLRAQGTGELDAMRDATALFVLPPGGPGHAEPATGANTRPSVPRSRLAGRPWMHDFPLPIRQVLATAKLTLPEQTPGDAGQAAIAKPARRDPDAPRPRP